MDGMGIRYSYNMVTFLGPFFFQDRGGSNLGRDPTRILINLGAGDGAVDVSLALILAFGEGKKGGTLGRNVEEKFKHHIDIHIVKKCV